MDLIAQEQNMAFFQRDAQNVRAASAIVLIGSVNKVRGLNTTCQFCGFQDCGTCTAQGGRCAYTAMDLGIAIGSAVSTAADRRADNRVLFSAGRAAMNLKLLGEDICQAVGIPFRRPARRVDRWKAVRHGAAQSLPSGISYGDFRCHPQPY